MNKDTWVKFTKPHCRLGFMFLSIFKTTNKKNNKEYKQYNVRISESAFEKLGEPKKVDISYNLDKLAIKIEPSVTGMFSVRSSKNGKYFSHYLNGSGIGRIMPTGKYFLGEDNIFTNKKLKNSHNYQAGNVCLKPSV